MNIINPHSFLRASCLLLFVTAINASAPIACFAQYSLPSQAPSADPLDAPVAPIDPDVKAKIMQSIAESLRAEPDKAVAPATDDPVLEDVLSIIRNRGSVLQGSALDPSATPDTTSKYSPEDQATGDVAPSAAVYVACEQLLRTARQLSKLPAPNASRTNLIREMRREAARMLIEAISLETATLTP
jgi:hypothetical protein